MDTNVNGPKLALRDHAVNAFQAGLLGIPVIGASLERLLFGSLAELRLKRVESVLQEVGEAINRIEGQTPQIEDNEDYAKLLESVIPPLGRCTRENKKARFRDLLINAAFLTEGCKAWDGVDLAFRLIDELDEPCLEILALAYNFPVYNDEGRQFVVVWDGKKTNDGSTHVESVQSNYK